MSHLLEIREDGTGAAAFAYKPAWHGLGDVIPTGVMTAREALDIVPELGSPVEARPVFIRLADGSYVEIPSTFANTRAMDDRVLGVVGERYEILQTVEAFSILDSLVDSGEAKYEAVISLRDGKQVSILAKVPQSVLIAGKDAVDMYICLTNTHDGTKPVTMFPTPVRVVCNNTLQYALSAANRLYKVKHTATMGNKLRATEARNMLGVTFEALAEFEVTANQLVDSPFTDKEFQAFLDSLVPVPADEGRGRTVAMNKQDAISSIYQGDPTNKDYTGTKWGAFNAVSTFDQHYAQGRETKQSSEDENRWARLTGGKSISDKAFALLAV